MRWCPAISARRPSKQGLIPVSQPQVSDLHIHDGEPLRFKASFEVMPEIKVEGYKELRVDKPAVAVTDEDVEQALKTSAGTACDFHRGRRPSAGGWRLCSSLARRTAQR